MSPIYINHLNSFFFNSSKTGFIFESRFSNPAPVMFGGTGSSKMDDTSLPIGIKGPRLKGGNWAGNYKKKVYTNWLYFSVSAPPVRGSNCSRRTIIYVPICSQLSNNSSSTPRLMMKEILVELI